MITSSVTAGSDRRGGTPQLFAWPSPARAGDLQQPDGSVACTRGVDLALEAPPFGTFRAPPPRGAGRSLLPIVIGVVSAISAAATAASPALLEHPLVLVGLSPRVPFLALAASDTPMWLFLAVALPRSLLTDPIYFTLGRRHGAAALAWFPGRGGRLARIAALSAPLLVLIRPIGRHLALAGAGRCRTGLVVIADLAGTAAFLLAIHATANAVA